jgi:hypothetical protein
LFVPLIARQQNEPMAGQAVVGHQAKRASACELQAHDGELRTSAAAYTAQTECSPRVGITTATTPAFDHLVGYVNAGGRAVRAVVHRQHFHWSPVCLDFEISLAQLVTPVSRRSTSPAPVRPGRSTVSGCATPILTAFMRCRNPSASNSGYQQVSAQGDD